MAVLDAELVRAGLPPLANPVLCTKKAFADMLEDPAIALSFAEHLREEDA